MHSSEQKEVNEKFGRKMNEDVNENRKLFSKGVSNTKGGKVESCSRIKVGNGMLALGENGVRKIWKEYFEVLYNIDTQEEVAAVDLMGFGEVTTSEENQLEEPRLR